MGSKDKNWYHEFTGLSISLIDEGKLFNEFLNQKYPASIDASYKVDKKRAFDRLQKVLENSPKTSENYKRLAIVLLSQSQPEAAFSSLKKAIATLNKALSLNPKDPNIYLLLAVALSGRGQDEEAKAAFQKTLMLESNKVYAYLYFSEVARIFQQAVNIELEVGKRILEQTTPSVFSGVGLRPSYSATLAEALETCQKASTENLASQPSFAPKEESLEYWVRQFNIAKVKLVQLGLAIDYCLDKSQDNKSE